MHILTSKYSDHLPLYRQAQIYAREGVELERSTMAEWVGVRAATIGCDSKVAEEFDCSEQLHDHNAPENLLMSK